MERKDSLLFGQWTGWRLLVTLGLAALVLALALPAVASPGDDPAVVGEAEPGIRTAPGGDLTQRVFLPLVACNHWAGFFDDFSNPDSGLWDTGEINSVRWGHLNGEFQIYLKTTYQPLGVWADVRLPDRYQVEVDVRQVGSGAVSYGLLFGTDYTETSWETYQVIVFPSTQVYFTNRRSMDGTWTDILPDWVYAGAIHKTGTNRLRVVRDGMQIQLYINGTHVVTLTDSTLTGAGRYAGIRAYSYDDAPVDVRFDNFRLSLP